MFLLLLHHHARRHAVRTLRPASASPARRHASKIAIPFAPPPVPVIPSCPAPTCACRESPPGLEIERETDINGSMASYARQILVCTGRDDWTSKIEEEEDAVLVRRLKGFLGRGGKFQDPYHNVMITNCSFPSASHAPEEARNSTARQQTPPAAPQHPTGAAPVSAFILPSFQFIPTIPTEPAAVEAFIKGFILPERLNKFHDPLKPEQKKVLLRHPELQRQFANTRPVDEILILICGHGGRDERCGKLGPLLRDEFEEKLARQNLEVLSGTPTTDSKGNAKSEARRSPAVRVGMISHIGGHKWAGNVIIYIPSSAVGHPLSGKGIWYGRVGPENVEGIVAKTVLDGKVIKDLFRGGIDQDGAIIRL